MFPPALLSPTKRALELSCRGAPVDVIGWLTVRLPYASTEIDFVEANAPLIVTSPLEALRFKVPPADTSCERISSIAPARETLAPDKAAAVLSVPPLVKVRSAVPVSIGPDGSVRVPPATRLMALSVPALREVTVKAPALTTLMAPPPVSLFAVSDIALNWLF